MKRTITVHECDRCGKTFNSPRDVALTVHTSRSCIGGGHATSDRLELCTGCADDHEAFMKGRPLQTEQCEARSHELTAGKDLDQVK